METKKEPGKKKKIPKAVQAEVNPLVDPAELIVPEEDPEIIPEEDPFETASYEQPEPGEGP